MALSLDDYRAKLISKIHAAISQDEVRRFIDGAIKALKVNKVNGHIISRFVDKLMNDLDSYSPLNRDPQEWNNIQNAKILLNRVKQQLNNPVHKTR